MEPPPCDVATAVALEAHDTASGLLELTAEFPGTPHGLQSRETFPHLVTERQISLTYHPPCTRALSLSLNICSIQHSQCGISSASSACGSSSAE